jgi:hypothetical protein
VRIYAACGIDSFDPFLVSFFVRPEDCFFVPTCGDSGTPSADAVKAGRRSCPATLSLIAGPRLEGGEQTVGAVLPLCYSA